MLLFLRPTRLFLKVFSLLAFHILQAHLSQIRKELNSCIICLITCPAVFLHKPFDMVEEILRFVPPLCILQMLPQLVFSKMDRTVSPSP